MSLNIKCEGLGLHLRKVQAVYGCVCVSTQAITLQTTRGW